MIRVDILVWFQSKQKCCCLFPIHHDAGCGFVTYHPDCIEKCFFHNHFKIFILKGCCILSNVFSVSNKIICFWFFGIDLCMLSQPCLPGISPAFLGEWFLWNVVGVDSIDWGFWHLFLQGYWSIVTFFSCVFFWFSNWGDVGLKKKS